MKQPATTSNRFQTTVIHLIFPFLLLIAFFLYVWQKINPVLIFYRQEPAFLTGSEFFKNFLNYPGGIVEYLSAFLMQFYIFPWIGALFITVITGMICWTTWCFLKRVSGGRSSYFLYLLPAIVFLALQNSYKHELAVNISCLLALLGFNFYLLFHQRMLVVRLIIYLATGLLLYYLAAGALLIFSGLCALYELFIRKQSWGIRLLVALGYGVVAVGLPWLAKEYLFIISTREAYLLTLPFDHSYTPTFTPYLFMFLFPVILLLFFGLSKLTGEQPSQAFKRILNLTTFKNPKLRYVLGIMIIVLLLLGAAWWSFNQEAKTILEVDYCARLKNWPRLLEIVSQRKTTALPVIYQTNRALFWLGQLPEDMFAIYQKWGVNGLLMPRKYCLSAPLQNSDILYELGHINEAQHWAHEALTHRGPTPATLKRLVLVNLIKGEFVAAEKFLNILKKTLFNQEWVQTYQRYLIDKSLLQQDKAVQYIRSMMPSQDFLFSGEHRSAELEVLLEPNRPNKMAFEYLMAYHLLKCQLGNFVKNLARLPNFKYPSIPRHYEEALLLYLTKADAPRIELPGYRIRPETFERFKAFNQILKKNQNNREAAQRELFKEHYHTYWYYILFIAPQIQAMSSAGD